MKILFCLIIAGALTQNAYADPGQPVLRRFKELYPNATKVSWAKYNGLDEVYFINESTKLKLLFDSKGHITQTIRYYIATELQPHISFELKEKHGDKKITSITEVWDAETGTLYYVNLENTRTLLEVIIDTSGRILETKTYIKK